MTDPLLFAGTADHPVCLYPALANRHGCITGATGTGKTVTLQRLAEGFSALGVPVFLADIKGDLSGLADPGTSSDKVKARLETLGLPEPTWQGFPVTLWDVFGQQGHPVRATVSDLGPALFSRLLGLNETQQGVMSIVFKVADDHGLLLLDLKDLRAMVQWVGDHAADLKTSYGNVSTASVGAIQRGLLELEQQGAVQLLGEPMLDVEDLLQTQGGRGVINILAADALLQRPKVYSTFLLWLLSDLYERLPEVGDREKPKLVFFFDEQTVRLIRSKGVGVFFVTQSPLDIPDRVLGQLGNRIQHALRAFTPRDQKAVAAVAETMRPNPALDVKAAISQLEVGEALISTLDEKGTPQVTQRALVHPPASHMGPISAERRAQLLQSSLVAGVYEKVVDRESAYEKLTQRATQPAPASTSRPALAGATAGVVGSAAPPTSALSEFLFGSVGPRGGKHPGVVDAMAKSAARSVGSTVARELTRGLLGSLLGGARRR